MKPTRGRLRAHTKTPIFIHQDVSDSGAVVLAIVLAHYGKWVPITELRGLCYTTADGVHQGMVEKVAIDHQLDVTKMEREKLLGQYGGLAIVRAHSGKYVVFEGSNGDNVFLNDPVVGRICISVAEFTEQFTSFCLALKPAASFRKSGRAFSPTLFLTGFLRNSVSAIAFISLVSLTLLVPGVVAPAFSKVFVDQILVRQYDSWLAPLLLGLLLVMVIQGLLQWLQLKYLLKLEQKISIALVGKLAWHLMRLPFNFFLQRSPGDLLVRMQSSLIVGDLLANGVSIGLFNLINICLLAAIMFAYDSMLALVAVGVASLNILLFFWLGARQSVLSRQAGAFRARKNSASVANIKAIETIKARGEEGRVFGVWAGLQASTLNYEQPRALNEALLSMVPTVVTQLATIGTICIGSLRVINGDISVGTLVAFQLLLANFMQPLARLIMVGVQVKSMASHLHRLHDIIGHPVDSSLLQVRSDMEEEKLQGIVQYRDVTFGFDPVASPLFSEFNLKILPGQRVALVGPSGSGKTTLGRLLCGLYQPQSGSVSIDGHAVHTIPRPIFSNSVGYVDQNIFLFETSVRNNLTLWDDIYPEHELVQALKDAEIYDDVTRRPNNLDCFVREAGTNFSGGQRQRLEIARALVANPTVLVLDEATSALDPITEKKIDDNLRRRGCTTIIIAHRLSTIRDCDEIIVLDGGKVVERGTHEMLIALDGVYRKMVMAA